MVADYSDLEREGVSSVERAFTRYLHWTFRDQSVVDYGIDAQVEPRRDGTSAGKLIALQIKAGKSYFRTKAPGGWYYPGNDRHLRYWLSFVLPVVVVLYDPDTEVCYWQHVAREHLSFTESGWKLLVPASQMLTGDAAEPLMRIAESALGASEDPLASYLPRLPPSTAVELEATDKAEPVAALHMAALLAEGSTTPELTVRALLAAQPSWWAVGNGQFDMVLATYASEHKHPNLTAEALAKVMAAREHPSAVLCANAAYFAALSGNRSQAEEWASLAEETGRCPLLCAVARAIASHEGEGPVTVPQALRNASPAELAREPAALLFLGENAMTLNDYEVAVDYLSRAVDLLPQSSTAAIGLARALLGRNASGHSTVIASDLRKAKELAERALEQRRRWSGPSGEALAVLIRRETMTDAFATALRMATPSSQGGEATAPEATCEPVAVLGAYAAMNIGDRIRAAEFAKLVEGTWADAVICALSADPQMPTEDRIAQWRRALAMPMPPEENGRALSHLAQLGAWPMPELDELMASGQIDAVNRDLLTAQSEAARGLTDKAVRRVRPHAAIKPLAAEILIDILASAKRHDQVVEECDRAIGRFGADAVFLHRKLNALALADRAGDAAALATKLLSDPAAPHEVRITIRRRLAAKSSQQADWAGMEEQCAAAIADGCSDPDVQWGVIGARFNQGNMDAAWARFRDLRPDVTSPQEACLWTALHAKYGFSAQDVIAALEFLTRWPNDEVLENDIIATFLNSAGATRPDGQPVLPELDPDVRQGFHAALEGFLARNPDGPLHVHSAQPAELAAYLRESTATRADGIHDVVRMIRAGQLPIAAIAAAAGWSYTRSLAERAIGFIPAVTIDSVAFEAEIAAARQALGGHVVADLSALAVATAMPGRWPQLIAAFTELQLTRSSAADIEHACRDTTRTPGTVMSIGYDSERDILVSHETSQEESQRTASRVGEIADAAKYAIVVPSPQPDHFPLPITPPPAWASSLELAAQAGIPLWADDIVIRGLAAHKGLPSFGTIALLHVLVEDGTIPDTLRADVLALAAAQVTDLALTPDELRVLAEAGHWKPGAVAVSMTRPAFWMSGKSALDTFLAIVEQITPCEPSLVAGWLAAACHGLAALVSLPNLEDCLTDLANQTADRIGAEPVTRSTLLQIAAKIIEMHR